MWRSRLHPSFRRRLQVSTTAPSAAPKRVIFRWGPLCGRGVGDALRGIITVHHITRRLGICVEIDMVDNELSDVLEYKTPEDTHNEYKRCEADMVTLYDTAVNVKVLVHLLRRRQTLVLFTNALPFAEPDPQDMEFVRNLMRFKDDIQRPTHPYRLIHIRVGDAFMVEREDHTQHKHWKPAEPVQIILSRLHRTLHKHAVTLNPGDFVITDCNILKPALIDAHSGIIMDDSEGLIKAGHLGMRSDRDQIAATVRDIQRIMHAKEVISFNTYGWPSNFVKWICKCYNIPVKTYIL